VDAIPEHSAAEVEGVPTALDINSAG
jgi:hypothetical protein